MNDAHRRRRFSAYLSGPLKGDRALLIRKTGLTKGRISQLLDTDLPFGERAAARLAERLGLPEDYFEHEAPPPPTAPAGRYADRQAVSQSDWALLEDVKLVLSDDELAKLRDRARRVRALADRLVAERNGKLKKNT